MTPAIVILLVKTYTGIFIRDGYDVNGLSVPPEKQQTDDNLRVSDETPIVKIEDTAHVPPDEQSQNEANIPNDQMEEEAQVNLEGSPFHKYLHLVKEFAGEGDMNGADDDTMEQSHGYDNISDDDDDYDYDYDDDNRGELLRKFFGSHEADKKKRHAIMQKIRKYLPKGIAV